MDNKTYMTSRLSRSGTISSTNAFGVFPSAVRPVAQFCDMKISQRRMKVLEGQQILPVQRWPLVAICHAQIYPYIPEPCLDATRTRQCCSIPSVRINRGGRSCLPFLVAPGIGVNLQACPSYHLNLLRLPCNNREVSEEVERVSIRLAL